MQFHRLVKHENILIVGHGAMNASIACQIQDVELAQFWKMKMGNCELVSYSEEMVCSRG